MIPVAENNQTCISFDFVFLLLYPSPAGVSGEIHKSGLGRDRSVPAPLTFGAEPTQRLVVHITIQRFADFVLMMRPSCHERKLGKLLWRPYFLTMAIIGQLRNQVCALVSQLGAVPPQESRVGHSCDPLLRAIATWASLICWASKSRFLSLCALSPVP